MTGDDQGTQWQSRLTAVVMGGSDRERPAERLSHEEKDSRRTGVWLVQGIISTIRP